jgi:uridine kinase
LDLAGFYQSLVDVIVARQSPGRAVIVGINGVDGSGKTMLATQLTLRLERAGYSVCRVSVDAFHHPKAYRYRRGQQSPEAYYRDAINYEAFADKALRPVFDARTFPVECQTTLLDLTQDREDARFQTVDENTVVLAEGVFIFRPEIRPLLHLAIFLDARFETILERVKTRDLETLGSEERILERYTRKYIPGQQLYLDEVQPATLADIVVDNNDFDNPTMLARKHPSEAQRGHV